MTTKEKIDQLLEVLIDSTIEQIKENKNIVSYHVQDKDMNVKTEYTPISDAVHSIKELIILKNSFR